MGEVSPSHELKNAHEKKSPKKITRVMLISRLQKYFETLWIPLSYWFYRRKKTASYVRAYENETLVALKTFDNGA